MATTSSTTGSTTSGQWTVDDHLRDADEASVALYRRFEAMVFGCGPVEVSPSKTTITFKGRRRGFAGARPTRTGLRGYLDLTCSAVDDPRIISSSPYTARLHVNQYRLASLDELDDTFAHLIREAYDVGQGAHLRWGDHAQNYRPWSASSRKYRAIGSGV